MTVATADNDGIGMIMPEYSSAGTTVTTAVATIAAIWVSTNTETSKPMPAVHTTYTTVETKKNSGSPLNGAPYKKIASAVSASALRIEMPTYGSNFPTRYSLRDSVDEYRL